MSAAHNMMGGIMEKMQSILMELGTRFDPETASVSEVVGWIMEQMKDTGLP